MSKILRIDDLGRIVIPREIRRKMNIHDGAALEVEFNEELDAVVIKRSNMAINELGAYICHAIVSTLRQQVQDCEFGLADHVGHIDPRSSTRGIAEADDTVMIAMGCCTNRLLRAGNTAAIPIRMPHPDLVGYIVVVAKEGGEKGQQALAMAIEKAQTAVAMAQMLAI